VFHQAHIVVSLAARMLLTGMAGAAVSHQLVPNVGLQPQRLFPGARVGDAVSDSEAEAFAFEILQRSCVFPDDLRAELLLRRLHPLRSALLSASSTAAHAADLKSPVGATARLYYAVVEIRDAALALRRNEAMALSAAFPPQGAEETCVQTEQQTYAQALKAATDFASTIRKPDMDMLLGRQDRSTDGTSLTAGSIDLCREASRLTGIM
jgi:hypothetical protein